MQRILPSTEGPLNQVAFSQTEPVLGVGDSRQRQQTQAMVVWLFIWSGWSQGRLLDCGVGAGFTRSNCHQTCEFGARDPVHASTINSSIDQTVQCLSHLNLAMCVHCWQECAQALEDEDRKCYLKLEIRKIRRILSQVVTLPDKVDDHVNLSRS